MPYIALDPANAEAAPVITSGNPLTSVGMTLESLRGELMLMLGGRSDVPESRYNLWVNQSYLDLTTSLDLDELKSSYSFPTVAAQPMYTLPSAVHSTRGAAVIDAVTYSEFGGRPLKKGDLQGYRMLKNETDEPTDYFRENQLFVLWPTPENVRTVAVDFWIRPDLLVDDTDSPIIPYEWQQAILLNARSTAYGALQEFDKQAAAENNYVNYIRRRGDRNAKEDEGRVVLSSVPRTRRDLHRTSRRLRDGEY